MKRLTIFDGRKGSKVNRRRTICEIHREIYDLCVLNLSKDNLELSDKIIILLEEAFVTGVKMTNMHVLNMIMKI